ncbi:LysM peptidoglycan-binding domain-containing M23 family metallopeptidase [Rickettsiales bacterium]|nr:LysM peptidoglycan-binding domain-containing M23 family metallopeptidase [Rickettsiales bacterium]
MGRVYIKPLYFMLSAALFLLCSCTQSPVDVVLNSPKPKMLSSDSEPNYLNPYKIVIKPNDTLYKIAKRNNVDIRSLMDINDLQPPYDLQPGNVLKLPQATFHRVKTGDSLYVIAKSYKVDLSSLIRANNLKYPYIIKSGQKLRMPTGSYAQDISDDADISVNKDIVVSDSRTYNAKTKSLLSVKSKDISPMKVSKNSGPQPQLNPRNTRPAEISQISDKTPLSFLWPVDGSVISRFGPKKGGLYNDGINISSNEGDPILAAEEGDVVYSGNELRGYGNLLLIKHRKGYLTAYAHASNLAVKKGSFVKKGQVIAYAGKTGNVSKPQLHFSIRKGRKALNPEKYLAK